MRKSFKSVVAGVLTLCVAGAISALGATSASAAAGPFDPDVNAYGTITLYDFNGNVITSGDAGAYGSATNPTGLSYAVASVPTTGNTLSKAHITLYNPQVASPVNTAAWSGVQLNSNTTYPLTTAPAPINASLNAATPMPAVGTQTLTSAVTAFAPNTAAGWVNLYQLRLVNVTGAAYAATTISIDPTTHKWTQTYPTPVTATTTTLAVTPASPATTPVNPTLTATVSPVAAGTVQFSDGATLLGAPVAVAAGVATTSVTAATVGTHSYSAAFTSTDPAFASSASVPTSYVVQVPQTPVTVGLSSTAAPVYLGAADTFTATALAGTPAVAVPGSFQFFDGTTSLGAASATATLTTSTLALGVHSITVDFIPTDLATYNNLTISPAVSVNVLAIQQGACAITPANCTDAQNFQATVPAGSIVISTPYHASNPFNIGTMVLNTAGTQYTASNLFGNLANPANGVTITDTRAGGLGWTASLQSGTFTNTTAATGSINGGNLGFTGVEPQYISGNALNLAPGNVVSVFQNAAPAIALAPGVAASGLANPQKFASALIGAGSVYVTGAFTLNAPSSVPAGLYGGIVTFTIA